MTTTLTRADDPASSAHADRGAGPDAARAAKRAKAEAIGRYAAIFIMPLIIVGMMITGYLGTMHAPTARDMPVAVTGTSEQAAALAQALTAAEPDALAVERVADARTARQQVVEREVAAAMIVDGGDVTLVTATAAGASQASTVTGLVTPVLLDEHLSVSTEDAVGLPESDPSGLAAMFLATALVMAGYLPFSVLRSNSPELLKFRRIVPLLAGWAALIAGLVWLVTGPILGVVSTDHTAAVLGIAWLGVFAIGAVQLFITRLFGALGVIAGMFLLMVLGMPASNMSMSVYTMPAFYRVLHDILPMPAIGEAMRSVLYFDGVGLTGHLLVLAIGAVAGLLATAAYDAVERRKHPEGVVLDVNIPSLHGGPRPKRNFWRYTSLLVFPLAMVTIMVTCMLGAMHQPTPRDMPVAVVGASAEQAEQTIAGLEEHLGDMFELTALDSTDEAADLVADRELVAALVLPSEADPEFTLLANQAGSPSATQAVTRVFTQIAAQQQLPLQIDDAAPLPDRDSTGTVTMYVAMGWILAGFMVVIVAANAAPSSRPLRRMLPITAGYAAFMSAVLWLIAGPITGAVDGHFAALWGAGAVTIFCVAMFAMVFERLLGMLAVIPVVGILMFLGVPASNGALSVYMVPEAFRALHDLLPMPAAAETVRSILYFGGDTVTEHLQVLGLWGLVSLVVVCIIDSLKPVRTEHDFGDLGLSAGRGGPTGSAAAAGSAERPAAASATEAAPTGTAADPDALLAADAPRAADAALVPAGN
ncbi:ABC transporter permease [Leucobacter luti]|uniref:ABC-2 type transporter transmembrane domain-containing protein n=1 Tax=Leucobacter luti TaxID=340320 RepID=A0A4Q7U5C9_9MICO|nr:ABC transporter permease [Leucobacter luti]MBL3700533.1 ABC transporter permease [Leucobacter luti]RZT68633.1 hypothetical protein EV139_0359 [Leucobacter luti]